MKTIEEMNATELACALFWFQVIMCRCRRMQMAGNAPDYYSTTGASYWAIHDLLGTDEDLDRFALIVSKYV